MVACHHLGQRYLWVDRLYNLQDDDGTHGHKQAQLNIMVEIYKHALLTLVAATGMDVTSGLSGMSKPLWKTPKAMQLGFPVSRRSIWETCGWTHPEAVLSRHMILFTEHETIVEDEEGRLYWPRFRSTKGYSDYHSRLISDEKAIENYKRRHLGCQKDGMIAFSGACNHIFGPH
ncbi:hypothetical protein JOL62DRAFT_104554 [Phyllosticta paracitricarpa]|uniref:Heterokaryon incompatibility domain-containing protein n=1 Tax=Phyllosticta paracitricarpa TaxID=2016321 RepID=A0ABR1N5V7_9PEZI